MDAFNEEIEIGSSVESFLRLLNSQRELFHKQIDQLQQVVVAQCKLTGVNPLAQEMAAGALSIKIGKRPRDLLNPKAVKYMQAVFSIKDAISKKESREIGALFGISVTQVRDFFVSQKSRVRKQIRLSREKATKSDTCNKRGDGVSTNCGAIVPADIVPLDYAPTTSDPGVLRPVPLSSLGPANQDEAPSTSTQDDIPPGIEGVDNHFVDTIFPLMRKEETFSGQVKLMEWILHIQDSSVLIWFLSKGGVMILTTWLSQAAVEEQTSLLLCILKVLCHLPLHKASPENMSAILQSVNGLRSYRTSDISNRARLLLSRWSKLFAKIQAMKKPNGMKSNADAHSQMLLKQSIVEIMGDNGNPDEILCSTNEISDNVRKLESSQSLKLLPASTDDSTKKHMLGAASSYNRERRKVQLVEQPGHRAVSRCVPTSRTATVNQPRPMSADDIQKAKTRALFMQNKYGKKGFLSNGNSEVKAGGLSKPSDILPSNTSPLPTSLQPKTQEQNKTPVIPPTVSRKAFHHEAVSEKCKRIQITWKAPPEIKLNELWRVGAGDSSKEIDIQRNRHRREKEIVYRFHHEIPFNPKEPWDREMDYDDTLTPEILTEQPPDIETAESNVTEPLASLSKRLNPSVASASSSSHSGGTSEPDLELLAVLLKNPELVFALTSGKAGNLSSNDTVRLLDLIKSGGAGSGGTLTGVANKVEEKVEVSLPSPTPASGPGTSGWRSEAIRNPFSKQSSIGNSIVSSIPTVERFPPPGHPRVHVPTAASITTIQQHLVQPSSMPHQASVPGNQNYSSVVPSIYQSSSIRARLNPAVQPEHVGVSPMPHHMSSQYHTSQLQQPLPVQQTMLSNSPAHPPLYSSRESMGNLGGVPDPWRATQRHGTYYPQQTNSNSQALPLRGGPRRGLNHYVGDGGLESWSPDNSPSRNFREHGGNSEWGYRADQARQQNAPGYWDRSKHSDRWRDQRR